MEDKCWSSTGHFLCNTRSHRRLYPAVRLLDQSDLFKQAFKRRCRGKEVVYGPRPENCISLNIRNREMMRKGKRKATNEQINENNTKIIIIITSAHIYLRKRKRDIRLCLPLVGHCWTWGRRREMNREVNNRHYEDEVWYYDGIGDRARSQAKPSHWEWSNWLY